MKILYSCPLNIVSTPSAGSHVTSVVKEWQALGHDVVLVHGGVRPQVTIQDMRATKPQANLGKIRRDWEFSRAVARAIRSFYPDIVYHRFAKSSFFPLVWAKIHRARTVVEINSDIQIDLRCADVSSAGLKAARWVESLNCRLADRIVVVSEGVAQAVGSRNRLGAPRISVVPNGADLAVFHPRDREASCAAMGLDPRNCHLAFAGTFQSWQGLATVVQTANLLRGRLPKIIFLLIGDGPMYPQIREWVRDQALEPHFHFPGWQSPDETAVYLGASDICLAPYSRTALTDPNDAGQGARIKGSPLKIFTYLAAGRPVLASRFPEAGMLVEQIGAGMAIEPDSPESMADAIGQLLNDPQKRAIMGAKARNAAVERYGWARVARDLLDVCAQALGRQTDPMTEKEG